MIKIDSAGWTYTGVEQASLHDISLSVAPGEFVVLCGASGSGKSTVLRLMNGLIPNFHDGDLTGTVEVAGLSTATARLDEVGLQTGTVLQHPRRQFFTDSAPEEVAFALENFGHEPAAIRTRVDATLAGLAADIPVDGRLALLSGGQQQQVALAAASAHGPGILLLDEPSSNLDADAVQRLAASLAELKARGITIVVAEHRLRYLHDVLDRVVVMRNGRIDAEWNAEEFQAVPDEALARKGLRGDVRPADVPALPAAGASVAGTAPDDADPAGALRLTGIRCRLGGRVVLDLDHVTFAAGTVTAIRGANGAGKSTLARVVTGLQRCPGTVALDGRVLRPRARQRVSAIVMQDVQRQLFTDSVDAEVELASGLKDTDVAEVLRDLDLAHLAERHPLSLSGGQQQRLVIAAARVSHRRIVIFDEPSSGVDRRHLRSISDQIRRVARDGAVVLLISHDEDLIALAADAQLTLRRPEPAQRVSARPNDG
ncbi:ABC transporter ATP-binding protein [Micromonospora craniellae]|uniref:ATP-binding cassette domain-containing protein n=1 Tax=Micromonospora craniellae TaxID=2294034 RepID=A0A372FXW5_9ACTN|nr:ABC transporter ATP-binding protein [Micromonospora craniellae]RFS45642.1 ATP-binding cassette domain-containing protein [Micromonospora craniellae]